MFRKENIPNIITIARIFVAVMFFVCIGIGTALFYTIGLALLIVAGITDFLDGYLARKKGIVSNFGRIIDPFADKVLICGGFIFLIGKPAIGLAGRDLGVYAWMVTIIVGRELLVTAIRSFVESGGAAFAATIWGKTKMAIQSVTLGTIVAFEGLFNFTGPWRLTLYAILLYAAVIFTALSGVVYLFDLQKRIRLQ